jgi:hypothetical protein
MDGHQQEQQRARSSPPPPPPPPPKQPSAADHQATTTTATNDQQQHALIRNLVSWAQGLGASFPKLQFDHAGGRPRRLLLTASADKGEALISLPRAVIIHGDLAYDDSEYGEAFQELRRRIEEANNDDDNDNAELIAAAAAGGPSLDPRSALVLLVAIERCRGPQSRWAPYIAALPLEYDDPAWWSPEDRALLSGTRLGAAADRYDGGLRSIAARLRLLERFKREKSGSDGPLSQGAAGPGGWGAIEQEDEALKAARWARSVVWSRAFGVARFCAADGNGAAATTSSPPPPRPAVCLLPVLDMADHHPDAQVAWHLGEDGRASALEFSSRVPLAVVPPSTPEPSEQQPSARELFNNYGKFKPTEELILAYGFDLGPDYARQHDGFLVSVALGGSGGGGDEQDGHGGGHLTPEAWDELAALQLRRCAVGGMARDVLLPPRDGRLPSALLDLLLAAAGAPDFGLQERQHGSHGGGPSTSQAPPPALSFASSPPSWRLAALDALEAQLRAKRAPLAWAEKGEGEAQQLTPHGRMARSYAIGQLARLDEALLALKEERAEAALDALRGKAADGGGGSDNDDDGGLPAALPAGDLSRAALSAEWAVAPFARFVREPWSLKRPTSSCPPSVGLAVDVVAGAKAAIPLLRLPLSACVAVPLVQQGQRGDAEAALIRAAAKALEAQALEVEPSQPETSWLFASVRSDATDGLLSAASLVATAAAAAAAANADANAAAPLAAEAASACQLRELVALARGEELGCDPDDDFASATRRLCARGILQVEGGEDEGGGGGGGGDDDAGAAALRAACRAHAALLVTRGGVLVASDDEGNEAKRWLVLAPVLSRLGGAVLSALPLAARVVASGQTTSLEVSLLLRAVGSDRSSGLLLGSRTGAAAEGRLAAVVAAEAGLAAAFSSAREEERGRWPPAVAGAVPWSRAVDDENEGDEEEKDGGDDNGDRSALKHQVRRLLAACCVGVGELLLLPSSSPPPPSSPPLLPRAERLVLAEMLASVKADDDDAKVYALLFHSPEALEVLAAQAASARAGSGAGDEAAGSASGLPSTSASAAATTDGDATTRRLDAARRAFAARCISELPGLAKEAARGLQRALKEMGEEAEGRAEEEVGDGGGDDGGDSESPLSQLVRRGWIGADARTFHGWSEEVGRWRREALGGHKKKSKDKKKKKRRRDEDEDEDE